MNRVLLLFWSACIVGAADIDSSCHTPNNEIGTCVPVARCSQFDGLKTQKGSTKMNTLKLLQSLTCGFEGNSPLVCCKDYQAPVTELPVTELPVTELPVTELPVTELPDTVLPSVNSRISIPDISVHRNLGLINPEFCGMSTVGERVINGNATEINEYPWMALLEYKTKTGYKFGCGGSLINVNYVLTAAHCITFTKDFRLIRVRLGEHDYSQEEDCHGEGEERICAPPYQSIDVDVESTIIYPFYSTETKVDDIALVRLARPADLSEGNIRPICLPVGEEQTKNLDNTTMLVAGWGVIETGYLSPVLLKVSLPIVSNEQCHTLFSTRYKTNITANQICAGGTNLAQDSCKGDSGGPLKRYGTNNHMTSMIQYGIVSFGTKICGTVGVPAVYTRVGYYMDWILDNIRP